MTLMRSDPFRELDRFTEQVFGGTRTRSIMPVEAYRRGDEVCVHVDLPGVAPEDVDVAIERNVVTIRATRRPLHAANDEVIIDERPQGELSRQFFLGDHLDTNVPKASFSRGVLTLRIPVSEESKPRRVEVLSHDDDQQRVIEAQHTGT
ncbi:Hsp20/alpha crystallin family protein [Lentzea sp. NPDC102401]|uniref:Hsp20/alpha crystallin family protein n=1 Tax=Lentzea sp. NPDC102401 TaxID=3364128 RepID=UPI0038163DB3